jgi:CO/xanthine dehydrogenase Mo-binding subunit
MDARNTDASLRFHLNGEAVQITPEPGERLSEVLRERLGARDVKIGCNAGDCGACSVLVGGDMVCACLMPAQKAAGQQIDTLSGLVKTDPHAKALVEQFQDHGAAQCGICTPGMMVCAVALLRETPEPSEEEVQAALGGVLCRCTGYRKIIDAVRNVPVVLDGSAVAGAQVRRLDGVPKVLGTEVFGDDVAPAGTLEIRVVRSPFAHAAFSFGDLEVWKEANGVEGILTADDILGVNRFGVIPDFADQPVFAERVARFRGEAVAAIVATPEIARRFRADQFPVTWTELESVSEVGPARNDAAPQLHADRAGNEMCRGFVKRGDAESALASADVIVEGAFSTGFVEHGYIEPEAGFARIVDGRVEVHVCTQAPVMNLDALETILGLARSQIRIVPTAVGGGFGSKLDLSVQPFLALAALKTERPVRLTYSRTESLQSTTKRHPANISLKVGATKDGKLSGLVFDGVFNTGAYASWGPTVANRVPVHASGPYQFADYTAQAKGIHTHCPPSGAFRGFGVPQSGIAQESLFDELAEKLGLDALEFRILNALENGTPTVCGQVFEQGVGIKECLEALRPAWTHECAEADAFNAASMGSLRRGVGLAAGWYGCGNTSLPNPSSIKAGIKPWGTVVLHQGAVDIGQGSNTVISQIFATALGLSADELTLIGADTDTTPDAGKTSASRQTFVSGNAARLAGEALRGQILRDVNASPDAMLGFGDGVISIEDGDKDHRLDLGKMDVDGDGYVYAATETYDPPIKPLDANGQGAPYAQYGYAAQLAVIEVDEALGTIKPIRFVAAHDVGKAINPMLVEGQVQGGIAQGLGMALMEEYLPGRTENLHDYLIPTIGDIPPIKTLIVEVPDGHGPYGAKGLGEHVLIPTAPALLNAVKYATGVRMYSVPVTPSKLRQAIKGKANG